MDYLSGNVVTTVGSFEDAGSSGDTLTRTDGGSWIDDGFGAGVFVRIEGDSLNTSPVGVLFEVEEVTESTLTFASGTEFLSESGQEVVVTPIEIDPLGTDRTITAILVAQREDIDITASGSISADRDKDMAFSA